MFADSVLNAARTPMSAVGRRRRLRHRLAGVGMLLLALVLAVTGQASPGRAASAAPGKSVTAGTGGTGTGGTFNPLQTRLVDTRNGTGGFSTPLPAGAWRAYTVAGVGGIPASGVTSVVVTVTVLSAVNNGTLSLAPNTSLPASPVTFLLYDVGDTVSNSGVVDVGTDGKIGVKSTAGIDVLIDVQGYFTAGNGTPAPGGYVSANNTRIVNTATGLGGTTGPLAGNTATTFAAVGGSTGVPTTATAIYANITVNNNGTGGGYVTPYATGTSRPGTSLDFPGSPTAGTADYTALGATIDLNSSGQFNLYVSGSVQVLVDVQGYFDGEPSTSGFTPVNSRIFDSRSPSVPLAPNSVTTVQVGGVGGIPAASNSLAGVALNVQALPGTAAGYLRVWSSDDAEPTSTSTINFDSSGTRTSNLAFVQPSIADGTIKIRNVSGTAVNVVLDAEGYLTNPSVLPQAYGTNPTASGSRTAASMISHTSTDRSGVQINPTNGNLLYSQALLNLTGIGNSTSVGVRYNALNDARPTLNTGLFEAQLYRDGTSNALTYTAPDGAAYVFRPANVSYTGTNAAGASATLNAYITPAGINATLVRVGTGYSPGTEYDLTFHPGQTMNVYADTGSNITLNSTQDVTGANHISYTYAKGALTTITDTQGRTVTFAYTSGNNTTQPSTITDNSLGRTITLIYGATSTPANGAVTKIVDATGAQTLFGYDPTSGKLSSVTDGRGDVTTFTYGTGNKLATMTAAATTGSGVPTTTSSTWTMAYPSSTSTTVADPNGKVDTYTYNSASQVTKVTDARGHAQGRGYNSHNDTTGATSAYNDTTSFDIATSTYNLTKVTSPSATPGGGGADGRTQSAVYTTAPSGPGGSYSTADYRPSSVTDTNTNTTSYLYNNFGETRSAQSAGGAAGTTLYNYQGDNQTPATNCGGKTGQLCKSTDGKGNITSYAYNSAGNLTTMTPPAPLGAHTFVYDAAGRKVSEHDGRGNTAYTCYDLDDRVTQVSYTTAACASPSGVTYTYDQAGNLVSRATAATGITVNWTYDAQNRPTAQSDSAGSSSASYDPAGNVLTYTDNGGKTTYTYDDTNNVTTLAEPSGTCPTGAVTPSPKCTVFTYDNNNKRLTTALPNGVTNTVAYDTSSREKSITAATSSATSVSRSYAYLNSGVDSGIIRTMTDAVANTTTAYTYDQVNRLAGDTVKDVGGYTIGSDSYLYDLNGNMTKQVTGGTTTYYGYNAADQMCWTATTTGTGCTTPPYGTAFTYDGNGNTLTGDATTGTNTWTNYNQQATTSVGGSTTYTYAGTTNAQRVSAGGITFTNSLLGQVTSQAGGVPTNEYIRDPDGTLIALQTGGNSYYYTLDNIGSVLQLTDNTGAPAATYTYNPYGKTTAATGSIATQNPYRYASGYTDTTGLIKFGARYYNPTLARFTQPDPSGQETNSYTYAGDDPVLKTDPSGLCGDDSWWDDLTEILDPCDAVTDPGEYEPAAQCAAWGGGAATGAFAYSWWAGPEVDGPLIGTAFIGGCVGSALSGLF